MKMRLVYSLFILIMSVSAFPQDKKMALIIGNSRYHEGGQLPNPGNDAKDVGKELELLGFDVILRTDLNQINMKKVIDDFGEKLGKAEIGLFFYAGHGVQAKGRNYLIPVDAKLKSENDVEYNCVDAGRILAKMEDANTKTNIVILDACRDNPFERSWSRSSNGNGLTYISAPGGSIIAYSTAPGTTASDGSSRNSPYTSALLQYMNKPNLKVEDFFKLVRSSVKKATAGEQIPWESTSLEGDFYFHNDSGLKPTDPGPGDTTPHFAEADNPEATRNNDSDYEESRKILARNIKSIVILPFANYTGDDSREFLAMGMQDALITELGQLGLLHVTSQTSTLSYSNFRKTIKEIASELKVDGVIETTLIGLDEKIRIQLKMYSVFPNEQLIWSQVFDSDRSDILNLYNIVIKNIADEIQLTLSPEQEKELEQPRKIDPQAYDAYLKGYYYWERLEPESMQKALEFFQKAIELEPDWADPYAGLANAWSIFGTFLRSLPKAITLPKTYKYLNKALELDPNSARAHYVKALVAVWTEFDWELGEKEFLRSLEINPNDALCRMYYSHLLGILLRNDEALKQADHALKLDPFRPLNLWLHGNVMRFVGDIPSAISDYENALLIDPGFVMARFALENHDMVEAFKNGDYDTWIIQWERKVTVSGHWNKEGIQAVVNVYHDKGHIQAISEMFKMNEKYGNDCFMSASIKAERYIYLKEYDKAIDCLEEDFEKRDMAMTYILVKATNYHQLKDHPRYIALLKEMNLDGYLK